MGMIEFTVEGEIPSSKNTLRVGRYGVYHADNSVARFKRSFALQTPAWCKKKLRGPVEVKMIIYQKNRRKDFHNASSAIMDALQFAGVIVNDRQVDIWAGIGRIDKKNPRVLLSVSEHTPEEVKI